MERIGNKCILAIDPGVKGFLSLMTKSKEIELFAMPDTPSSLYDLLSDLNKKIYCAYIENVSPWACRHSLANASKLMMNKAYCEMACLSLRIPINWVKPEVWQKSLQCLTGGDKKVTKKRAQELFPERSKYFTLINSDVAIINLFGLMNEGWVNKIGVNKSGLSLL